MLAQTLVTTQGSDQTPTVARDGGSGTAYAHMAAHAATPSPATRAEGEAEQATDLHTGYRGISALRSSLERRMENDIAAHFAGKNLATHTLQHILATHRNAAAANYRGAWPPFAEAVRVILAAQDAASGHGSADAPRQTTGAAPGTSLLEVRLTPEQRDALIASIRRMLETDVPDNDEDLAELLEQYRTGAYNLGGQEALDHAGLPGTFSLTNAALLAALQQQARNQVPGIQATTRDQVAHTIAEGLVAGESDHTIMVAARSRLADMAQTRAPTIAATEVANAYYDASGETWSRNGFTHKVWRTGEYPDPGSKRRAPCQDNAYAGAIPMYDVFPGGVWAPPQHPNCICDLLPSGNPSDAAKTAPWVGG